MADPGGIELLVAGLLLAALVAVVVARPLRAGSEEEPAGDGRRAALEAAKEAKYREIRDAELDFQMGKLSEPDYRATDRELRAQAIALLHELDRLDGADPETAAPEDRAGGGRDGAR